MKLCGRVLTSLILFWTIVSGSVIAKDLLQAEGEFSQNLFQYLN
jgi:hypothetical protein